MKLSQTVAIVGGGFSGISVATQIALLSKKSIKVILFNYKYPVAKGVAYQSNDDEHLLNVSASGMSFFADQPTHFVEWLKHNYPTQFLSDQGNHDDSFLPRWVYGQYITSFFNEVMVHSNLDYQLIEDEVTDIQKVDDQYELSTLNNFKTLCNKIIFALGNDEPEKPGFITNEMMNEGIYVNNPWMPEACRLNDKQTDVLLLGSGLTMVDNLLSLLSNGFVGNIHVVSTKGFFPVAFRKSNPDLEIINELKPPYNLNTVFDIFRKHVHRVRAQGISGGAVVAALRPITQKIWTEISHHERIRFLSHVRHLWGVARHRVPVQPYNTFAKLVSEGRVKITAGRLINIELKNGVPNAIIKQRRSVEQLSIPVQRVINCTGPLNNIKHTTSKLLQNLFKNNLLEADQLLLGINATAKGAILHNGKTSSDFFTIGSMLKGVLWETTAVKEIRDQSRQIAEQLLQ